LSTGQNGSKRVVFSIFSATRHEGLPQAVEGLCGRLSRRLAADDFNFLQKSMKSLHTKVFDFRTAEILLINKQNTAFR
jgi:hypothetical protein